MVVKKTHALPKAKANWSSSNGICRPDSTARVLIPRDDRVSTGAPTHSRIFCLQNLACQIEKTSRGGSAVGGYNFELAANGPGLERSQATFDASPPVVIEHDDGDQ